MGRSLHKVYKIIIAEYNKALSMSLLDREFVSDEDFNVNFCCKIGKKVVFIEVMVNSLYQVTFLTSSISCSLHLGGTHTGATDN